MSPLLMTCSQKLFLCKQSQNLGWTVWRRLKCLLKDISGGASQNGIHRSHFPPGSLSPTLLLGLVWTVSVQVGGHLGAILLLCWSRKSFNLGSFSVYSSSLMNLPLSGYPLISEENLTQQTPQRVVCLGGKQQQQPRKQKQTNKNTSQV